MKSTLAHLLRIVGLVVLCGLSLQIYFLVRIAMMNVVDPQSTTFQRSEMRRIVAEQHQLLWSQQWMDGDRISDHLKRAVIASEDAGFAEHSGVEWEALEKAWEKNLRAEAQAERINERQAKQAARSNRPPPEKPKATAKIVGGSTITQQLAKNLFLSGERNFLRKGQEFVITFMLEGALSKRRILEIYLNNVEWGEGLFGAQAAARHYFHVNADKLGPYPAARLAVMLPAPKRFEKRPNSAYVMGRASTVVARMGAVELP
ncbi:transglycosylase domain-containing protein [Piscinibacter sp. HJYY11]|uniref:transglycosylase domain-containing protein n=1 Tax=Piscinibacter sp. HJYY11 TaxID=2801333 RepID=UPI00191D0DD6|nr:transglycosylase domain-containing protein [Piscinibacter sp. HJYY11]MBL0730160.1 transglycosylase domain-containing protein [Piscinibacter sp. HJYY11]